MAEKRMFSKKITDSDSFIELSSSAQALYFHLNQGADDDGFNNQVQSAIFKAHASLDDLKTLMTKNFIIRFDNGVIVIKHWRMHNTLRKDRYTPTNFQEELSALGIKDNGSYALPNEDGCRLVADWLPCGCRVVATDKDSIGKISKEKKNNLSKSKYGQKNCIEIDTNENILTDCNATNDLKNEFETLFANEKAEELEAVDPKETMFNEFWKLYPKKVNKKGAKTSFMRIKGLKKEFDNIMLALKKCVVSKDWQKQNGQFIPHPQTWINQERWKDKNENSEQEVIDNWLNE